MMDRSMEGLLPAPAHASAPFWDGCDRGELLLQRCAECSRLQYFPRIMCAHCGSERMSWTRSSGKGTIFSRTSVEASFFGQRWTPDLPYTVVIIDLDEGVRFLSRMVGERANEVSIGDRVEVAFTPVGSRRLPFFRRAT